MLPGSPRHFAESLANNLDRAPASTLPDARIFTLFIIPKYTHSLLEPRAEPPLRSLLASPGVTMTEPQNGIDILCDAAGPDLLLGTFLPASSPPQEELRPPPPPPPSGRGAKRIKVADDASPSVPAHVCHICKRVYERF
ncbi:transcription factor Pig1p [Apiospora arundinis]|uniref:Transcription factor Pig1p n=1 Tax=Apiospora arundinis TaxID=335852 RepID=A0ABR2HQF2_9PEZI